MAYLFNVPNVLSLSRIALGAACLLLIVNGSRPALLWGLALIVVSEGTDFLDGYVARRTGTETAIGRHLDTTCDAIFHFAVFLAFLAAGWMALWMIIAIYVPEIFVPYLRSFSRQVGVTPPSRKIDQAKASIHGASQFAIVFIALFRGRGFEIGGIDVVYAILVVDVAASLGALVFNTLPLAGLDAANSVKP